MYKTQEVKQGLLFTTVAKVLIAFVVEGSLEAKPVLFASKRSGSARIHTHSS